MMASACVNNIGMSPETFLDCPSCPSYGWLSPRISFSRDVSDDGSKIAAAAGQTASPDNAAEKLDLDSSGKDLIDFEFRLEDPVTMLPADELFSDGKLVPLQLAAVRPSSHLSAAAQFGEIRSVRSEEASVAKSRLTAEISAADQYLFSPKAPRCSSRWRELLGLKKIQSPKPELQKSASVPTKNPNPKSLKHFLHRSTKSSADSSLSLPLLRDSDSESVSISSRLSLSSSSSSGPDHEDLPRLSLDSDKPNPSLLSTTKNPPRVRISKPRTLSDTTVRIGRSPMRRSATPSDPTVRIGRSPLRRAPESTSIPARGASVDSPRMNSSGKIVFQSLERSSSSPSSFNGGSRNGKIRGMERSYSANVRITPVLNVVPVCSLRGSSKGGSVFGFGQLFSPQKRDGGSAGSTGARGRHHHRSRNDRI